MCSTLTRQGEDLCKRGRQRETESRSYELELSMHVCFEEQVESYV